MKKLTQEIVRRTRGRDNGNGFVHYTPDANYSGAAGFNYSIKAATGQRGAANDGAWFYERWAA